MADSSKKCPIPHNQPEKLASSKSPLLAVQTVVIQITQALEKGPKASGLSLFITP